ncbi:MAG: DsrH/TusB family sulfur metabolism protein [Methylococcales bacterium]|nr:DsrH/TusB family sulfur metabolism protein [Methylococcales bacterium]
MLHLISLPVLQPEIIERIAAGDDVLLQHNLVWLAKQGHSDNARLLELLRRPCGVYVMQDMLTACGMAPDGILPGVSIIDYSGLVELTVKNPVIHTWC